MSLRVRTYVRTTVVPRRRATVGCGSAGVAVARAVPGRGVAGVTAAGTAGLMIGVPRVQLSARSCRIEDVAVRLTCVRG